ncbi:Hsp20/alpha crystallin family protein, partial [Rickettsiella grylli]|uniref:Hsp20/alpha crystallin family protein n=1 Tax=Rickettsiella grylli TaxID=59196 RepID=UPI00117BC617
AFAQPFFSNPLYFNRLMMQEKPKQYLISFDMPGVDPHKIKVSISQGILFVKAKSTNEDLKRDDHNQYAFSYHV